MVKGTDLVIGLQVLLVQLKISRRMHAKIIMQKSLGEDKVLLDFLKEYMQRIKALKTDLENALANLGNSSEHVNMDNLDIFTWDHNMPGINKELPGPNLFNTLKAQSFTMVETCQKISAFKIIPTTISSILLVHLCTWQDSAIFLMNYKKPAKIKLLRPITYEKLVNAV
ncbi:MAG: hypothetical protein WA951_04745 [Leeuwenhoekiella sp.]